MTWAEVWAKVQASLAWPPLEMRNGIKHAVRCYDCGKYQDAFNVLKRIDTHIAERCQYCGSRETHWERAE
jgi:translation initiation factor 2 beta subunit (eIF-2beta)/eIF-5